MIYVIQMPHSGTNPTSRYRVIDSESWIRYVDGNIAAYPVHASHSTYDEARAVRDILNGGNGDERGIPNPG